MMMNFLSTGSLVGVFAHRVGLGKGPVGFWGVGWRRAGGELKLKKRKRGSWNGEHGCGISTIEFDWAVFPQQIL